MCLKNFRGLEERSARHITVPTNVSFAMCSPPAPIRDSDKEYAQRFDSR